MNFDKSTRTIASKLWKMTTPLILLLLLPSCAVAENKTVSMKNFFQQTTSEQIDAFGRHQIEDQYAILYFGNKIIHPPAVYLIQPFAEHGQSAVPFLEMKLISSRDDSDIRNIVLIFNEMSLQGNYLIPCESTIMSLLEKKVLSLKNLWKPSLENTVREIKLRSCALSKST